MKIPFRPTPNMNLHFMALKTDWVEKIGDDNLWLFQAQVENGDFNAERHNLVQLKVLDKNADIDAISHGGLAVFSNIKKTVLRKALLTGIEYMQRTGQLTPDDFQYTEVKDAEE